MAARRSPTALGAPVARAGDLAIDPAGLAPGEVERLLDMRDRVLARRGLAVHEDESGRRPVMLVRIGERRIGIPMEAVAAILPPVRPAIVPGAAAQLIGLFAHDGAIHNLFAIEAVLGLPPSEPRAASAALLLRRPGPRIAIAIDEAIDVVQVTAPEDAPAADDGSSLRFVAGDGEEAIVLVDVERLVAALGVTGAATPEGKMK